MFIFMVFATAWIVLMPLVCIKIFKQGTYSEWINVVGVFTILLMLVVIGIMTCIGSFS